MNLGTNYKGVTVDNKPFDVYQRVAELEGVPRSLVIYLAMTYAYGPNSVRSRGRSPDEMVDDLREIVRLHKKFSEEPK